MADDTQAGRDQFYAAVNVSRETREDIEKFDALFLDWSGRLNLVARSTIQDRWRRHYLDSAQILTLLPTSATKILDLGSGAGFPGLFLALLANRDPARKHQRFWLVDSVGKKCAFLREVAAHLALGNVTVLNARIEDIREPDEVDVVTARALANLDRLLQYAEAFLHNRSICLFQKGERAQEELTAAAAHWKMEAILHPSCTNDAARILEIRNPQRV